MTDRRPPVQSGLAPIATKSDATFWLPGGAERAFWEPPFLGKPDGGRDSLDISALLEVIRRRWVLVLLVTAVLATFSTAAVLLVPPRYAAEALIMLDTRKTQVVNIEAVVSRLPIDTSVISSEVEVIGSSMLIGRVVDRLGLVRNPILNPLLDPRRGPLDRLALLAERWLPKRLQGFIPPGLMARASGQRQRLTLAQEREQVIEAVQRRLVVSNDGKSYGVSVRFESRDPRLTTDVVNTVADQYIADQIASKGTATRLATVWLKARLDELRESVRASDEAVQRYRDLHRIFFNRDTPITVQLLSDLNSQLVTAMADRIQKTAALQQLRPGKADDNNASFALASPLIQQLRTQEAELMRASAGMRYRYGSNYPALAAANVQLANLRQKIQEESARMVRGLENDVTSATAREMALRQAVRTAEQSVESEDSADIRLRQLQREAEANQTIYKSFLARYMETSKQEDLQQPDARIISLAEVPTRPSFPRTTLFIVMGGALSLVFGIGSAFVVERSATGFRSPEQVRQATGLPALGMLPVVRGAKRRPGRIADEIELNPGSPFSESVRGIRNFMHNVEDTQPIRRVLISSAMPGEGKTTFAVAAGRSLARAGRRVLLIDCDLRRSALHKVLDTRRIVDLEALARGRLDVASAIGIDASGMHFIASAPVNRKSRSHVDFLDSEAFRGFLEAISEDYDLVLIDSPPVGVVSDAIFLGRHADAVLFVVRCGKTQRKMVAFALEQLRTSGAHLAGIVLSQVDMRGRPRYERFGYGRDPGYSGSS